MPTTTCGKCRRANPAGAAFCYFDGSLLNGHGAAGPVAAGRQAFAHPFVFPSGRQCRSFDELALACADEWAAARGLLRQNHFERFFSALGRTDLARAARAAARDPDADAGLDELLDKLPSDVPQPAQLHVGSPEINLGTLAVGTDRRFELRLDNRGTRLLRGSVSCDDAPWLSLGDGAGTSQKLFQFPDAAVIPVHVIGQRLRAGTRPLEGQLVIESNGGNFAVTVTAAVPIKPFPDGVLRGAQTPRQVAEKAKAAPREAAPFFENGAVAAWYESNGWTYPVQGPAASGLGAVQQFFEALGLTPPPRVEVSTRAVTLTGAAGERLDYVLQVATPEKRPVYAHGVSDQPWLRVGRPSLQGRIATIPLVVPEVPDRPGEQLRAQVTVTANGNQHFPVAVSLTVERRPPPVRRPQAVLEVMPPPVAAPAAAPVALPVAIPIARAEPAAPDKPPAPPSRRASPWLHLAPVGALLLALLGVLGVDALRPRQRPPEPAPVPVVDDSIDPVPLIDVGFHDRGKEVTLAFGGSIKPGEERTNKDEMKALWEPSMRFGVAMRLEGDPLRPGRPKRLTFEEDGTTNNTVVLLDGQNKGQGWIFGELPFQVTDTNKPYRPEDFRGRWKDGERDVALPAEPRKGEGRKSAWLYDREKVTVTQYVQVVPGAQSRKLDTCLVRYEIKNDDGRSHRVGLRFMLDTFIGSNDGVPFTIPGEKELCDTKKVLRGGEVPDFLQALERESLTEPGTIAQLQLRLGERIEAPDRVTLGAWPNPDLARPPYNDDRCRQEKTPWEVPVFPIKTLTPPDSCVTLYWDEKPLPPGETRVVGFAYGLGNVASDKDAAGRLGLSVGGRFVPNGEFTLTALVSDPRQGEALTLELPDGFRLAEGEATQKVPPVPAEAVRRTSPVTWKIRAGGEGSYTLTVKSSAGAAQAQPVRIRSTSIFD